MMRTKLNITNAHNINIIRGAERKRFATALPSRCGRLQCRPYGKIKRSSSVPASSASPARALARRGIEALILERHGSRHQNQRPNSGSCMPASTTQPDRSKARLCVAGRINLRLLHRRGIAHPVVAGKA